MSTLFQPEEPHPQTDKPASKGPIITLAIGLALAVMMILALVGPRFEWSGATLWLVTIGAGVVTALVVGGVGFMRGPSHADS